MSEEANKPVKEKKDKQKVIGETFTEDMLTAYVNYEPSGSAQKEFDILLRAYRGMPEEAFENFLKLYKQKGYDINAKSQDGTSFLAFISRYPSFQTYVDILKREGATSED